MAMLESISLGLLLIAVPLAGVLLFIAHSQWIADPYRFPRITTSLALVLLGGSWVGLGMAAASNTKEIVPDGMQYTAAAFIGLGFLALAIYLSRLPKDLEDQRQIDDGLRGFGWAFILLPTVFVIAIPVIILIASAYFALLWFRWRRQKQAGAMTVLSGFVSLKRPISELFQVGRVARTGWRRKMNDFAHNAQSGMSLADAVDYSGIASPTDTILLRAAELGNAVERELPRIAGRSSRAARGAWRSGGVLGFCFYIEFLAVTGFIVGGFVMYWIVPKLKSIFDDFGTELPMTMQRVISASDEFVNAWPAIVGNVAVWLMATMIAAFVSIFGTRVLPTWLLSKGPRNWTSPTVLRVFATLVESGASLSDSLKVLSEKARGPFWRNRWQRLAEASGQGIPPSQVLVRTGDLPARGARGVDAAASMGPNSSASQASVLRTLADGIERSAQRRFGVIATTLAAVLFTAIACCIAVSVVGVIATVTKLIGDLS